MKTTYEIVNAMEKDLNEYLQKELERYKLLGYTEDDLILDYIPSRYFSTLYSDDLTYTEHFEVCLRPKTTEERERK